MAQKRRLYPNSRYGRRKDREDATKRISNYTTEERAEYNKIQNIIWFVAVIILIVVGLIVYLVSGQEGLMKWLR